MGLYNRNIRQPKEHLRSGENSVLQDFEEALESLHSSTCEHTGGKRVKDQAQRETKSQ